MIDIYESFGKRIRSARRQRNMSQGELGRRTHLTKQAISKMETGRHEIRFHNALLVALALDLKIEDFQALLKKHYPLD